MTAPTTAELVETLALHVHRPVLWRDSLESLASEHPDAVFVEVGPRAVLSTMLGRRWLPRHRTLRTDSPGDLPAHFASVVEELVRV